MVATLSEPISFDTVRIEFTDEAVVDATYLDTASYTVAVIEGAGDVAVRRVLTPMNAEITNEVILVVDKPRDGTHYRVSTRALNSSDGGFVTIAADFIGRRTKSGDMLRKLPAHFDVAPESVVSAILTAVGISDDAIGGSRDDTLGEVDMGVLLLEDGSPLLTDDFDTITIEE